MRVKTTSGWKVKGKQVGIDDENQWYGPHGQRLSRLLLLQRCLMHWLMPQLMHDLLMCHHEMQQGV